MVRQAEEYDKCPVAVSRHCLCVCIGSLATESSHRAQTDRLNNYYWAEKFLWRNGLEEWIPLFGPNNRALPATTWGGRVHAQPVIRQGWWTFRKWPLRPIVF